MHVSMRVCVPGEPQNPARETQGHPGSTGDEGFTHLCLGQVLIEKITLHPGSLCVPFLLVSTEIKGLERDTRTVQMLPIRGGSPHHQPVVKAQSLPCRKQAHMASCIVPWLNF